MDYGKRVAFTANDADRELWKILVDVPRLKGAMIWVCALFNVGLPGSGTMIAACVGEPNVWSKTQLFVGLLQMLTAIYIIGLVWSIYWSYLFIIKAQQDKQEVNDFLKQTNVRSELRNSPH